MSGPAPLEIAATWVAPGQGERPVRVDEVHWSGGERRRRAVLAALLAFVGACVALFIPVLHFLLVPGMLIGGVVAALRRWRIAVQVTRARGVCPSCDTEVERQLDVARAPEIWTLCPSCQSRLRIRLDETA